MDPPKNATAAWRILVVDDEQSVQAVLGRLFARMGQTVRGTLSATEALALLREPWDLFIIDKNLPQGSGLEVAKAARRAHPEAIIILVTAFASRDSANELVGIVDEYITKPFDVGYLREIVTALMDFREVGQQARGIATPRPPPSQPGPALATTPAAPPRAGGRGAGLVAVHIVLSDAREEAMFLSESRKAGVTATSGPLTDTAFPDVVIVDGKSATFELRKAVWARQARVPALRVVMVVEQSSLGDSTAALALKASHRLQRPLALGEVAQLLGRLKG